MNFFQQNKIATIIITVLIVLNLTSLYFFVVHNRITGKAHPHGGHEHVHEKMREQSDGRAHFIEKRLGFDKNQRMQFRELRKSHFERISQFKKELTSQRELIFENLSNSAFNSDSLTSIIANNQASVEKEMFNHFKAVRGLCSEAQKTKFDTLIKKITRRMTGKKHYKKETRSD